MSNKRSLKTDQRGIASLLFSMIMMIVISLIVLSFAQIARNGQREALDNQLSTQAYYAAESGVNDVTRAVEQGVTVNNAGCGISAPYQPYLDGNLDGANKVSYTCVKIDQSPGSLQADVSPSVSRVLNIDPVPGISKLTITWSPFNSTASTPYTGCPTATKQMSVATGINADADEWGDNCPYGMLRFDLVPTSNSMTRNGLLTGMTGGIIVPTRNSNVALATIPYTSGAVTIPASCNNVTCSASITLPNQKYSMRLMSKYLGANGVKVTGEYNGNPGVTFAHSQVLVDITGKAQDVLRRIQVRLPLTGAGGSSGVYSNYAIGSEASICKHYTISDQNFNDDTGCPALDN